MIQFPDGSWGVIDSNRISPSSEPAALTFLRENNVEELAFVCLTHPHEDHYAGLSDILRRYEGKIEELWVFRLDAVHWKKFLMVQKQTATSASHRRKYEELREIFMHLQRMRRSNRIRFLEANISLPDHGPVRIDCLAPHPKNIGPYQRALARWIERPEEYRADENRLSAVLRFRYHGSTVLLSSDTPKASWTDIYREAKKRKEDLQPDLVKVSHHGSRDGFHSEIWKHMTRPGNTHGAISAGPGYGHPHKEVIISLSDMKVRLHCTNYPSHCLKQSATDLSKFQGVSERLKFALFMLDQTSNSSSIPCNGNLHFSVSPDGTVQYDHQYSGFCPLHIV